MKSKKKLNNNKGLKIVAYIFTILFAIAILYPLFYIASNSLKDNVKIYDMPPSILPDSAKSISIVLNYDNYTGKDEDELLETIKKDTVLSMFATINDFKRDSIYEVKFYGVKDNKTVYYSRAHKMELELERDFGVYANSVINNEVILTNNRYNKAMDNIKYDFNIDGVKESYDNSKFGTSDFEPKMDNLLNGDFKTSGDFMGLTEKRNNFLLLESFAHYNKLPAYAYSQNKTISKYSFLVFVMNTVIVILWAILTQTVLCSLTAFSLSRLLPKKNSNPLLFFFLATMMIPFASIMIPQFTMFKDMGLYDNYGALLVPFLLPYGFFIYLYKGFFDRLPNELFEAAKVDGASNLYCYFKICMPLSKSIISIIALQTFLSNWNDFFWAWMVTEKQELWTLNVALYNLSNNGSIKQNFILGLSLITILPVILLTIILSNQIKESIASTGLK